MSPTLAGKTAVVTGAASGIGRGVAERLAAEGARIVAADLSVADEVLSNLPSGPDHSGVALDVAEPTSVETAFADIPEVDILVNSAGIREITEPLKLTVSEWDRVIGVNLSGTFHCAQVAARRMVEHGGGAIVNMSSVAGLAGFVSRPAYSASKAGVLGLTRSLSQDLAPFGVRVNAICPGLVATPLTRPYIDDEEFVGRLPMLIPMGRPGTVADVAEAALFLAGPQSSYVTGVEITVDGGWHAAGTFDPTGGSAYAKENELGG